MNEAEPKDDLKRFDPRRLSPPVRFVLLMGLYLAFFQWSLVKVGPSITDELMMLCTATAQILWATLEAIGAQTTLHGNVISLGGFSVRVIVECTGLFEMVIFAACVLAYPSTFRSKMIGIGFGFASIYVFNLLRIGGLLAVGRYAHHLFEFFHIYFWQITLVGIIVANWLLWLNLVVRREPPH